MFHNAKARAKRDGIEFSIKPENIVIPQRCPILRIELVVKGKKQTDASPSLDRTDPNKGYVADNIQVISYLANRIKTNATARQVRQVADYMESVNGTR
jgi:hypothetical protein